MLVPEAAGVERERGRRRRRRGDAGALGSAGRALGARLRGARAPAAARRRHVRRRAALRHRRGARAARRRRGGLDRARRVGRRRSTARSATRSVVEEEPLPVRIEATRGRLPLPPGWIDEPLLPEPVRLSRRPLARARARGGDVRPPRPARARAARRWCCATRSGSRSACSRGAHADEVLVLPRVLPVRATAGGGEGVTAHARAALDRRGRDRDRRPARAPRGLAGVAHPLADASRAAPG